MTRPLPPKDPQAVADFIECAKEARASLIRETLRADPEFALRGITHLRRVATDPAAPLKDRRAAARFLRRHGFDDESLAHEE